MNRSGGIIRFKSGLRCRKRVNSVSIIDVLGYLFKYMYNVKTCMNRRNPLHQMINLNLVIKYT